MALCAVCLSPIEDGGEAATVRTACRHHFHFVCLLKCMEHQGAVCPICRQAVDTEVAAAPRPWMGAAGRATSRGASPFSRGLAGTPRSGALLGLAATEAAVAVEIAESVRRSLAAEEEARWVAPAAPVHVEAGASNDIDLDVLNADVDVGPSRSQVAGMAVPAMAPTLSRARNVPVPMRAVNRWDFPGEFRWYAEIAEAVARSLAEDAQYLQQGAEGNDAGVDDGMSVEEALSAVSDVVDPRALAGVEEAVLLLQDANILRARHRSSAAMTAAMSALPLGSAAGLCPFSCQRRAEEHRSRAGLNIADFNVADVVGIARAVLRSLNEDSPPSRLGLSLLDDNAGLILPVPPLLEQV